MKAVVLTEVGGPEKIRIDSIALPEPGPGEVRVKLKASALNRRDYWITVGLYPNMKLPCISGSDGAGVVDAVGKGGGKDLAGREVVIYPARNWGDDPRCFGPDFKILGMPDQGTFAEYVCVPAQDVYDKPAHLDWEEAAAIPLAGLTAWRAVVTQAEVRSGQKALVTGAGSGVSSFAILWAIHHGAEVWVTSGSAQKIEKAKSLGAKGGGNYNEADCYAKLAKQTGGFDFVIDSAGGDAFNDILDSLKPAGRFVFFGATKGVPSKAPDLRRLFFRHIRIQGTTMGTPAEFRAMLEFVTRKKIRPVIDRVLPMERAVEAYKLMERFSQTGKIVLRNE
ncbi:MAG: zinc-binding dehydrogenase [Gammaproteobacteria bacterium]